MQEEISKKEQEIRSLGDHQEPSFKQNLQACLSYLAEKENSSKMWLQKTLIQSIAGKLVDQVRGWLTCISSLLFVVISYLDSKKHEETWFNTLDVIICFIFLFFYIINLYVAQHRIQYFFSVQSLLDLFIIVPILVFIDPIGGETARYFLVSFSRYFRMINFGTISAKYHKLGQTEVDRQINIILITMIMLLYVSSGIYSIVENSEQSNQDQLHFHESLYFVIVTLSTVGYGDIQPQSEFGKLIVLFIVVFTIVLIPQQTNELLRLMSMQSRYRRTAYKSVEVKHILVTGYVGLQALKNFCEEIFHQDHGNQSTNAVILQSTDPKPDMEIFIQKYEIFLTYLSGNPLDERDLKRGDVQRAETCVLLTNKNSKSANEEDYRNILTALAIKKYVYDCNKDSKDDGKHNAKLCMQLIKPESKTLYYKSLKLPPTNDQLIIVEEIKMNLLAKSCFAPGLISLISNLFASAGDINTDEFSQDWLKEYAQGMGHEIYRINISEIDYQGRLSFKKVSEISYTEYSAIVFALEIELKNQPNSIVRLNPSNFVFIDWHLYNYYLYVICEDEAVAKRVQKMDMQDDRYEGLFGMPRIDKIKLKENIIKDQFSSQAQGLLGRSARREQQEEAEGETKLGSMILRPQFEDLGSLQGSQRQKSKFNLSKNLKSGIIKQEAKTDRETDTQDSLFKHYDILSKPQSQMEMAEEKQLLKLQNHIVVCGIHSSIYHFILPLRAKYLKSHQQDIVIITPLQKGSKEIVESIATFPRVFLVTGSPLSRDVLRKAQIQRADKAVILGFDHTIKNQKSQDQNDEMMDAQSIFIYKAIKRCNPNLQIMIELSYSSNIDFLLQKNSNKLEYTFSSLYAAGEVYIASIIDTLTAQAFYNPHIVTILSQILVGKVERADNNIDQEAEITKNFDDKLTQGNLWQIAVPEECVNQPYDKLFKFLLDRNLVPLALYRLPGANDNKYPYVYSNPEVKTNISQRDKVFVLGKEIPKDLIADYNVENIIVENDQTSKKLLKDQQMNDQAIRDFYGLDQSLLDINKQSSVLSINKETKTGKSQKDPMNKRDSKSDNPNQRGDLSPSNKAYSKKANEPFHFANHQVGKEQNDSLEFMTKAVERLDSKVTDIEDKIRTVKELLSMQDQKIIDEIHSTKAEFLKRLDSEG